MTPPLITHAFNWAFTLNFPSGPRLNLAPFTLIVVALIRQVLVNPLAITARYRGLFSPF